MIYNKEVKIDVEPATVINKLLKLRQDESLEIPKGIEIPEIIRVEFPGNVEMLIKFCGYSYLLRDAKRQHGNIIVNSGNEEHSTWVEAVLLHNDCQVAFTDAKEEMFKTWILCYNDNTYAADVVISYEN